MQKGWAQMRQLLAATVVALACAAHPASADETVQLAADAGLGGIGRPGRWLPVRIAVANSGRDLTGELVVTWGDTRLHRSVLLSSPSRMNLEVYVRTMDTRGAVDVRLVANGIELAAVDAPVRMAPDDARLTVCVGDAPAAATQTCSVTMPPSAVPRSMRGYDAADAVIWRAGPESPVAPEQQDALRRWRAFRAGEDSGVLSQAPRPVFSEFSNSGVPRATAVAAGSGITLLLLAGLWWLRTGGSPLRSYAILVGAIAMGVACSVGAGRVGPGATVVIRHASAVQQVGDGAVATMRGSIEYPAYGEYALTVQSPDAMLTRRGTAATEHWSDSSGQPTQRGVAGRGQREDVELEDWAVAAPFEVTARDGNVRVANVSQSMLTDCRFPDGFSRLTIGTLSPGQTIEAQGSSQSAAPFFSCTTDASPISATAARTPVRMQGRTIVSVLLPTPAGEPRQ